MIFSIFILLFSKVNAFAKITVSPGSVEQGNGKTTSITVNVGGKDCYVKYTESIANPTVSSMFFIKAGDDTTQEFSGSGIWYLHVYVPETDEWSCAGPYKGDLANPNEPIASSSANGWVNTNVEVSILTNGDNGSTLYDAANNITSTYTSGVKGIYLDLGDNKWTLYPILSTKETITSEGWRTVSCYVADNVGNKSPTKSFTFGIDKTKPNVTLTPLLVSWTNKDTTVKITPYDSLSGVKKWRYCLSKDGGVTWDSWSSYSSDATPKDIVISTEGNNKIKCEIIDNANNTNTIVNGLYQIDKSAPTVSSVTSNTDGYNKITVNVNNVNDHGLSGSKEVDFIVKRSDSQVLKKTLKVKEKDNIKQDFTLSELGNVYGEYIIEIWTRDNIDNERLVKTLTINLVDPKPINSTLSVEKYKYLKDSTYWVNCKENFIIKTQCNSSASYANIPNETILYMGDNSSYATTYSGFSSIVTTTSSDITKSTEKDTYINKYIDYFGVANIITKTLSSSHNLLANADASGRKYALHTIGRTSYNGVWFLSTINNSSYNIGIDGIAPTIDKVEGIDEYNKFTVKVTNIYDHDLSGSKEVDFIVKRNGDNIIKKTVLVSDKSTISQVFTKDELKGYGEYTVEVWTRDNVDNEIKVSEIKVTMLNPINIAAKRVDIYDPREERYVSQVVSGLDYIAVVEYTNTGAEDIDNTRPYSIGLNIADVESGTVKGEPLQAGETKEARFNFTAGEENLLGNVYEGTIDIDNELEESNEGDNAISTKQPYKEKVSDTNPPTIPTPNTLGKPSVEVPIITIKLDFIANYINVVELGTENNEVDELICEDPYRLKYKVSNNSSLNIKYIDIKNKSFETTVYYDDNTQLDTIVIDDIGATENKIFYKDFTTPLLANGVVEENKALKEVVDSSNKVYEMDEKNNSLLRRKKVLALKVTDYRITEMVNPIQKYTYPIMYTDMPANCKSGYNVTFRCNVKGNRDKLKVIAKLRDTNGTPYDTITMTRVSEVSNTEGIYEYVLTVPLDLPQGTIISSEVIATQDTSTYNFNNKNLWNGKTLTIGGNAKEDIVIYRKY